MKQETQYAGALILQPDLFWANQVEPEDMTDPAAARVVKVVSEMLRDGSDVDVVSVAERACMAIDVVGRMTQEVYAPVGAASAARQIRDMAERRRAIMRLRSAIEDIEEGETPREAIRDLTEAMDDSASEGSVTIAQAVETLRERQSKPIRNLITTPITKLDNFLKMSGGKLVIVAGRPGTFKSAFALHVARHTVIHGKPVGIVSLEMMAHEIGERWLLQAGDRDPHLAAPLLINHSAYSLGAIESQIIAWSQRDKVCGVVIDYLQLINAKSKKGQRRDEVIGEMTRALKLLAMRLDIPIILLSQLNRESEKQGRRPILSDLRESGSIEQDADAVIFMHRQGMNEDERFELILAKQRGGPTGIIDLHIDKARYLIWEADRWMER